MNLEQQIEVSQRLKQLADMLPGVAAIADIGTDHAQLLIYLIQQGRIQKGIGVDVVEGPYQTARQNVKSSALEDLIEIRKGDGLAPIKPGEAELVVIAGLGGKTIQGILERKPEVVNSLDWLLLQPMSQAGPLRQYVQSMGWRIKRETLVEDREIIYPIILAEPGYMQALTRWEAEYGPIILKEKPQLLTKLIKRDLQARQKILDQITKSNQHESRLRAEQIKEECAELEGLLGCL